ncbi:response regulator [Sphingomonas glacialis]|uniref:Response regulator n=1 Tax=Sphingomonas glacialis TaxID=658225 RepID=A0A502FRZ5_9SPHN|nr:response regulator [Sphingomonas glacialis]TPG52150.1 response regulator [Sphingomonas glacialis]
MHVVKEALDAADSRPARLLVVEDELLIRMLITDVLRDAGYEVIEAVSGDEALDLLKAGVVFDLVLSDVRMPGSTDGLALLAFARQNLAELPFILTSGHLAPEIALAEGAVGFLAKPYGMHDALAVVEQEVAKLR